MPDSQAETSHSRCSALAVLVPPWSVTWQLPAPGSEKKIGFLFRVIFSASAQQLGSTAVLFQENICQCFLRCPPRAFAILFTTSRCPLTDTLLGVSRMKLLLFLLFFYRFCCDCYYFIIILIAMWLMWFIINIYHQYHCCYFCCCCSLF